MLSWSPEPCPVLPVLLNKRNYVSLLCLFRVLAYWPLTGHSPVFLHICFLGGAADDVGLPQLEREGENEMGEYEEWGRC